MRSAEIMKRSLFLSGVGEPKLEVAPELGPERGGKEGEGGCGDAFLRGGRGGFSEYEDGAGLGLRLRGFGDTRDNVDALLVFLSLPFPPPTVCLIILSSNPTVFALS